MREESSDLVPIKPSFIERGGGWVLIQTVLMLAVLGAGWYLGGDWPVAFWGHLIATGCILLGAYFGIAGVVGLGSGRTIFPHPLPDAPLVTTGVYGLVRHPLYASLIWLGVGWGLWHSSAAALGVTVLLTVFLDAKSRREETWLRHKFPGYSDYAQRVHRLLPWVY
ncbi:MAG: isoprenylcysteine carboxylmethyltransferase family protein [Verrucomicrobiales bacterium]|nr:isoprenylcysteine carboxylmethyltransferase family protein [Verrucomicrobiales bacterium]MCP5559662.1 isoprenylcysteine carboxylmethyltransferase family protein [Verrucomicrobiaceae bacterium]